MRVTVIPEDKWIRRDEDATKLENWPFDDASIHAIQWHESYGEIEYKGTPKPPNEQFTNEAIVAPYVQALEARLVELQSVEQEPTKA